MKISAQLPAKFAARAEEILNSGNDKQLLKLFRDETTLIVLMVRVRNEERRAAWEVKHADDKTQDEYLSEWPGTFEQLERETKR